MIYNAQFDAKKAQVLTVEHLKWRAKEQAINQLAIDFMVVFPHQNASFLFPLGKDKQFRPIVYVRLGILKKKAQYGLNEKLKYEEMDVGLDWIISLIRKECYRPYFIENWIMIVDADDMGILSFPIGFFSNLLKLTQVNHPACLHKMFVVNPPFSFGAIFKMISRKVLSSAFLDGDTKEKITFLKKKEFHKILEHVDSNQLLEEYGGSLKMPQRIWPPVDTYSEEERKLIQPILQPESEGNKYLYTPGTNDAKKILHSVIPNPLFSAADFETRVNPFPEQDLWIPSEPRIQSIPQYQTGKETTPSPENLASISVSIKDQMTELVTNPSLKSPLSINATPSEEKYNLVLSQNDSTFGSLVMHQPEALPIIRSEPPAARKKCNCTCVLI